MTHPPEDVWSVAKGRELYRVDGWGAPYFSVSETGCIQVQPDPEVDARVDLFQLVSQLNARGHELPLLVRFPNILEHRLKLIDAGFREAMAEADYRGAYQGVYPVKVNQQRHLVEDVVRFGAPLGVGLEAGSKPELLIALAALESPGGLIVCNGYKDLSFMELAIAAQQLDRRVVIVLERPEELELALEAASRVGVKPLLGVRARLHAKGSGRWGDSSGHRAKFGLSVPQLLDVVQTLKDVGLSDSLQLLHFHIGSQISSIIPFKRAIREASQLYVQLTKLGCGLRYLDVGGGLAVDYDGTRTAFHASKNYDVREYALDIVYGIREACDQAQVAHPTIITEAGRAIAAYQSALVFEVVGANERAFAEEEAKPAPEAHRLLQDLYESYHGVNANNLQEAWHDALQGKEEAQNLFRFGLMDIQELGQAERLFWACCARIRDHLSGKSPIPEELQQLEEMCSAIYYCNFSIFQSAPDSWAIDQVFPIVPIHRLGERPTVKAVLADLTCDSDGIIDRFIGFEGVQKVLPLHEVREDEPYLMAMFLNGAYQEILGDLHNLFGDTHAVHVRLRDGRFEIADVIPGDSIEEVLRYVQYDPGAMVDNIRRQAEAALQKSQLTVAQMRLLLNRYTEALRAYTYLGEDPAGDAGALIPAHRSTKDPKESRERANMASLRPPTFTP